MRVSEIRVKRIRVNQGLGVTLFTTLTGNTEFLLIQNSDFNDTLILSTPYFSMSKFK